VNGACAVATCNPSYDDCNRNAGDGCETNVSSDANNCGSCGNKCIAPTNGTATCSNGVCGFTCNQGYTQCGNACVDVKTDFDYCGSCDNHCVQSDICKKIGCVDGVCIIVKYETNDVICPTGACCGGTCCPFGNTCCGSNPVLNRCCPGGCDSILCH
jgi:hypothetical protein